jgi:hypothetical protein
VGRYLAYGIATRISISKKKGSSKSFEENKQKLIDAVSRYINIEDYNITYEENSMTLEIKEENANKHLHSMIREVNPLLRTDECILDYFFHNEDVNLEEFTNEKYPLEIHKMNENDEYEHEYDKHDHLNRYVMRNEHKTNYESYFYNYDEPEQWLLDCYPYEYIEHFYISISYIEVWRDFYKFAGESAFMYLKLLNKFRKGYFKNPLCNDMLFYMYG